MFPHARTMSRIEMMPSDLAALDDDQVPEPATLHRVGRLIEAPRGRSVGRVGRQVVTGDRRVEVGPLATALTMSRSVRIPGPAASVSWTTTDPIFSLGHDLAGVTQGVGRTDGDHIGRSWRLRRAQCTSRGGLHDRGLGGRGQWLCGRDLGSAARCQTWAVTEWRTPLIVLAWIPSRSDSTGGVAAAAAAARE